MLDRLIKRIDRHAVIIRTADGGTHVHAAGSCRVNDEEARYDFQALRGLKPWTWVRDEDSGRVHRAFCLPEAGYVPHAAWGLAAGITNKTQATAWLLVALAKHFSGAKEPKGEEVSFR
jgi:hypothetical protein